MANRLNSKYYRHRREEVALKNIEPQRPGGGLFSKMYDRPRKSSGGLVGFMRREEHHKRDVGYYRQSQEAHGWKRVGEDRARERHGWG